MKEQSKEDEQEEDKHRKGEQGDRRPRLAQASSLGVLLRSLQSCTYLIQWFDAQTQRTSRC